MRKENQNYQGGLIRNEQPLVFDTLEEKIEEISISDIQHFTLVPDYMTDTDSKYPFVVKTPSSTNCIDGWNLIEQAKAEERSSIICKVEYITEYSDEELAIRKVALRVKPKGGTGSYAEIVRNTKLLEKMLLASNRDLKVFQHGGDRKGESFINNRKDNVREVLSDRLGKSVSTINQFLNHACFLNEDTLNFLAAQKVKKDFFEEKQKNKRVETDEMKAERKSHDEITAQISKHMRTWYEQYHQGKKITPITSTPAGGDGEDSHPEIETPQVAVPRETGPKVFDPWYGNESEDDPDDSLENIKHDVEASAHRLLEAVKFSDPDQFEKRVREEVGQLCHIPLRLCALKNIEQQAISYKEVDLQ